MKTETMDEIRAEIRNLTVLYNDIYDYDYDETALWCINEAINNLKNAY